MRRLEEILSEHIEGGAGAWKKLYDDIEQYARECCIATQQQCLESTINRLMTPTGSLTPIGTTKISILNPDNIVLL